MARKAAEMFAARDIEDYYSKQQIFEMYAGSCYFGNQWSGVAQAAQGYFGKPTRELTRAECVVLAGCPTRPRSTPPTGSWPAGAHLWWWSGWSAPKS